MKIALRRTVVPVARPINLYPSWGMFRDLFHLFPAIPAHTRFSGYTSGNDGEMKPYDVMTQQEHDQCAAFFGYCPGDEG